MKILWKNTALRTAFGISAGIVLAGIAIAFFSLQDTEHPLIIHFDRFRGIDFLGTRRDALGILLTGLLIVAVNALLAEAWYRRRGFLSYLFGFVSIVISLLILIAVGVILSVNL